MNSIELNVTRKFKIILMSKYLYPEYRFSQVFKDGKFIHITIPNDVKTNIYIHWFEFCLTYLLDGITYRMPVNNEKQQLNHALMTYLKNGGNVVDFLYNEYRKL